MRQKLNLVTLGVKDFGTALEFYQDGLGWKLSSVSQDSVPIAFFDLGGVGLAICPRKLLAEDATIKQEGSGFSGITLVHNAKSIEEVDSILYKAEQAGAKIIKKAQKVFGGGYSGYFALLFAFCGNVGYYLFLVLAIQLAGVTISTLVIGSWFLYLQDEIGK